MFRDFCWFLLDRPRGSLLIQAWSHKFLLGPGLGDHYAYLALGAFPNAVVVCVWLLLMGGAWFEASRGYVASRVFLSRLALFPLAHGLVIAAELMGRFGIVAILLRVAAFLIVALIIEEAIRLYVVFGNRRVGRNEKGGLRGQST
jgi:hypothetical protein